MKAHQFFLAVLCLLALQVHAQKFEWVKPESSGADVITILGTAVDGNGNSYSLMQFEGTITIEGNSFSPLTGFVSNLVIKHNSQGVFQWAVPFGDTSGYYAYNIEVDNNKVYVFYETNYSPTVFPDTIVQPVAFAQMAKLDNDGNFISVIPMGINCNHPYNDNHYFDIYNGNIFYSGCENGYEEIRKINPAGVNTTICTLYDTVPGSEVQIEDVKCTPDGDILISGMIQNGTLRAGTLILESYPCCNGLTNFIIRIDSSGNVKWGERYSWLGNSFAITGDANGNSYLASDIRFPDFKYGNLTLPYQAKNEAILFKLDTAGNIVWYKTYYSTANSAYTAMSRINDVYVNNQQEIYLLGFFWGVGLSPYAPYTPKPDQHYMLKLDSNGNKIWVTDFNDMPPFPGWKSHLATADGNTFHILGEMIPGSSRFGCFTAGATYNNFYIAALKDTASPAPYVRFESTLDNTTAFFTNYSANYDSVQWSFGDSTFSNKVNPSHIYASAGVYNVALAGYNSCGTNYANIELIVKGVGSFTPAYAGNQGYLVTDVYGAGFTQGTTLVLSKPGFPDIVPDTVIFVASTRLKVNFNFNNELIGFRDVVVNIPGSGTYTLTDGFEIQTQREFDPWIEASNDYVLRLDQWKQYEVKIGNNGNQAGYGISVYLETNGKNEILLDNAVDTTGYNIPASHADSIPDGHFYKVYNSATNDSVFVAALMIPFISPGETFTIRLFVRTTDNPLNLIASVQNSSFFSPDSVNIHFKYSDGHTFRNVNSEIASIDLGSCSQCMLESGMNIVSGCVGAITDAGLTNAPNLEYIISGEPTLNDVPGILWDWGASAVSLLWNCAAGEFGKIAEWIEKTMSAKSFIENFPESCKECWYSMKYTFYEWSGLVELVQSDLNLKTGNKGMNSQNFISNKSDLFYNINFENADSSRTSAKEIVITDQIDTSMLDLTTFKFSGFGFGGNVSTTDIERNSFIKDFDLRPDRNCIMRANFSLDEQTGVATWRFTSFDPVTLDTLSNSADGFLPPNIDSPEGEGFVKYHIKPKSDLPHMSVISNDAIITFDHNAPFITDAWINTIDTVKPQSNMLPLPTHVGDTSFVIRWAGSDAHAGILDYKVYVSVNDSAYKLLFANNRDDSVQFTGKQGYKYEFYSIARDLVLNVENPPANAETNPDAVVIVDTTISVGEIDKSSYDIALIPNPAQKNATASFNYKKQCKYELQLLDMAGRTVKNYTGISKVGENKIELNLEGIAKGIYQTIFKIENNRGIKKLVVN